MLLIVSKLIFIKPPCLVTYRYLVVLLIRCFLVVHLLKPSVHLLKTSSWLGGDSFLAFLSIRCVLSYLVVLPHRRSGRHGIWLVLCQGTHGLENIRNASWLRGHGLVLRLLSAFVAPTLLWLPHCLHLTFVAPTLFHIFSSVVQSLFPTLE